MREEASSLGARAGGTARHDLVQPGVLTSLSLWLWMRRTKGVTGQRCVYLSPNGSVSCGTAGRGLVLVSAGEEETKPTVVTHGVALTAELSKSVHLFGF